MVFIIVLSYNFLIVEAISLSNAWNLGDVGWSYEVFSGGLTRILFKLSQIVSVDDFPLIGRDALGMDDFLS